MTFRGPISAAKPPGYSGWTAYSEADAPSAGLSGLPVLRGGTTPVSPFVEAAYPGVPSLGITGAKFLVQLTQSGTVATTAPAANQPVEQWKSLYGTPVAIVLEEAVSPPAPPPVIPPWTPPSVPPVDPPPPFPQGPPATPPWKKPGTSTAGAPRKIPTVENSGWGPVIVASVAALGLVIGGVWLEGRK